MWHSITVEQYAAIQKVLQTETDDLEKISRIVGVIYNLSEKRVDSLTWKKFNQCAKRVSKLLDSTVNSRPRIRLGLRRFDYNIPQLRFAQYIEVQHFISQGLFDNLHRVAASISDPLLGKNDSKNHDKISSWFAGQRFTDVYGSVSKFLKDLDSFQAQYKGLFQKGEGAPDPFLKYHGWRFTQCKLADHLGVPLNDVDEIPLVEAFNIMAYLKDLKTFEDSLNKKREKSFAS